MFHEPSDILLDKFQWTRHLFATWFYFSFWFYTTNYKAWLQQFERTGSGIYRSESLFLFSDFVHHHESVPSLRAVWRCAFRSLFRRKIRWRRCLDKTVSPIYYYQYLFLSSVTPSSFNENCLSRWHYCRYIISMVQSFRKRLNKLCLAFYICFSLTKLCFTSISTLRSCQEFSSLFAFWTEIKTFAFLVRSFYLMWYWVLYLRCHDMMTMKVHPPPS